MVAQHMVVGRRARVGRWGGRSTVWWGAAAGAALVLVLATTTHSLLVPPVRLCTSCRSPLRVALTAMVMDESEGAAGEGGPPARAAPAAALQTPAQQHCSSSRACFLATTVASAALALMPPVAAAVPPVPPATAPPPRTKLTFTTTADGLQYADIRQGSGRAVESGQRINLHLVGRLAGRQGWQFEDTYASEPFRFTLGRDRIIAGLEEGLVGMREGGRRRLIIPSALGYTDRTVGPVPSDFGNRQRLYNTVLNDVRRTREREALGQDLVGVLLMDIEVLRVLP